MLIRNVFAEKQANTVRDKVVKMLLNSYGGREWEIRIYTDTHACVHVLCTAQIITIDKRLILTQAPTSIRGIETGVDGNPNCRGC